MYQSEKKKQLKESANKLPLTPGVYIMHDINDTIIYIGKAKALKSRVTQYFGSNTNHNEKVRKMVENVDHFEYILCDTEFEAFILENSLIKQHKPKYNILLKDDKGYHYVKITDDKWKKIRWVKQKDNDGKYIGPYNSGFVVRNTVEEAQKVFKIPVCNRSFDRPSKPCLNYHIGICSAPCKGKISLDEYNEQINSAITFIRNGGYGEDDLKLLRKKMESAAENLDFEYAAKLRDRINAVTKISERQKVISSTYPNQDVFAIAVLDNTACVQLFTFRNGKLTDQNHYIIEEMVSKADIYSQFLPQFYSSQTDIPPRIVIDDDVESASVIESWLTNKTGRSVKISVPLIGEQKRLVEMCHNNATEHLAKVLEHTNREETALTELSNLLGLKKPPRYIESYDISNTAGDENVAAMVVHFDGKPLRSAYRKFKIKSFIGQDDYRSMAEVLDRRFTEMKKGSDEAFKRKPDLILLDGGKGQISAVIPVMKAHNVTDIPIFGMVKDSKHRTRAIAASGGDIALKPTRRSFTLVTKIQDETHRCAISYHKRRKSNSMLQSELLNVEGIGNKRAEILFKHFKTLEKIRNADIEQLKLIDGITEPAALAVYNYFHSQN